MLFNPKYVTKALYLIIFLTNITFVNIMSEFNFSIPEFLRSQAIENLYNTPTFKKCMQIWKSKILDLLEPMAEITNIYCLGDHLSEIFKLTGIEGRDQGELSAGGTAWESLVCWYLNLCLAGTRSVAIKKMSLVPIPIQDAITINYGNFACNTESDITIVTFPNLDEYNCDIENLSIIPNEDKSHPTKKRTLLLKKAIDRLCERDFRLFEIGIVQCKTNWNDNAQIPMLWDMIYSAGGFRGRNITIGRNNFSIQSCAKFTYAFVTVPSNSKAKYESESVCVKRVTNLSGGNYWGKKTVPHVARSIKEIFNNNFTGGARDTLRTDLQRAIPHFEEDQILNYFFT